MADNYEVLSRELTILKDVGVLTDPVTGNTLGVQQGRGEIHFRGEIVSGLDVSTATKAALEDEYHPGHSYIKARLKKVSDAPREDLVARLRLPFGGYDELSEDEVLDVMKNLPSAAIQQIKVYESEHENRSKIAYYNIGFGQDPKAIAEGRMNSESDDPDEEQASAFLKTRTVSEDGEVEFGEGITGTGDPEVPHGTADAEAEGEEARTPRRSRRRRVVKTPDKSSGNGEETTEDNDNDNEEKSE